MRKSRGIGSRQWERIRRPVLDRDNYQCQAEDCGKMGRMEVHHVDKNPYNHSMDNLLTLCVSHHIRVHLPIGHVTPDWKGFGVD